MSGPMQPLLSDLCSICHKSIPKYRCPACSTRTCSLECVQRHKSWGCSGKRDPTSFVKKSQLATAPGVDHDYNFISGIERSRDRAEEYLQGRSIQGAEGRSTKLNQPAIRNRLQLARVVVEYAPLGMSRQKLNKTKLTQSKRINWTVEWIHEDRTSTIGSILDDEQICKGYRLLYQKRTGDIRPKRKRDEGPSADSETSNIAQDITTPPVQNPVSARELRESSTLKHDHEDVAGREPLITQADGNSATDSDRFPVSTVSEASQVNIAVKEKPDQETIVPTDEPGQQQPMELARGSPDDLDLYYYLVKPRTRGAEKVLIPLSPMHTFLTCLQDQTVLEFPSIQVLPNGPDALPAGFVTEDQYLAKYKKEAHEMEQLIEEEGEIDPDTDLKGQNRNAPRTQHAIDTDTAMPNTSTLLDTLERDIRS